MEKNNTGLGLIKATIERVQNEKSLFNSALKKLVNSSEEELDDFLKQKLKRKNENKILSLISGGEQIMIKALDGRKTIAGSGDVFKAGIDSNFVNWGLNKSGTATSETIVAVYEPISDAMFAPMFQSLSDDLEKLVLSQSQIINFCLVHYTHLCQEGKATFFLIKKDPKKPTTNDNLFVVYVSVSSDGLHVFVRRFGYGGVWGAEFRRRVVIPRIIP